MVLEDARIARIGPETMKMRRRQRKGEGRRKGESVTFYMVAYPCVHDLSRVIYIDRSPLAKSRFWLNNGFLKLRLILECSGAYVRALLE
jgi:hypothetical protein